MKAFIILITLAILALEGSSSALDSSNPEAVLHVVRNPNDLKLTVTHEGDTLHQSVDDQQGQVTDQFVSPGEIRQVVHRKGVVVLDQIVKSDGTVKQLVP